MNHSTLLFHTLKAVDIISIFTATVRLCVGVAGTEVYDHGEAASQLFKLHRSFVVELVFLL